MLRVAQNDCSYRTRHSGAFGPSCHGHPRAPCSTYFCPAFPAAVLRPAATERRPSRHLAIACPLFHLSQALTASPCSPQMYHLGFCSERQASSPFAQKQSVSPLLEPCLLPALSKTSYTTQSTHFFLTWAGLYPFSFLRQGLVAQTELTVAKDDLKRLILGLPPRMLGWWSCTTVPHSSRSASLGSQKGKLLFCLFWASALLQQADILSPRNLMQCMGYFSNDSLRPRGDK